MTDPKDEKGRPASSARGEPGSSPRGEKERAGREARLAAALKANLMKRKAAARAALPGADLAAGEDDGTT
jgi:hypothetical protein